MSLFGVTGVLTGVETVEQMAVNVEIAARGPLPPDGSKRLTAWCPICQIRS